MRERGFISWLVRGAFIGFVIGTIAGLGFVLLSTSLRPLALIPVDTAFGFLLGSIGWLFAWLINVGLKRSVNKIIGGAIYGAMIGAIILMPFSEGLLMAIYVAVEGAILGGLFGTLVGALLHWKESSRRGVNT